MDAILHQQFKNISFSDDLTLMFATILKDDDASIEILRFIAAQQREQQKVSVQHLIENITLERLVGTKTKNEPLSFKKQLTTINRKAAERIVDKLSSMSLLYYEEMKPYKFFYITKRGINVFAKIQQLKQMEGSNDQ